MLFGYFLLYGELVESETCFCAKIIGTVLCSVSAVPTSYNSQAVRVT